MTSKSNCIFLLLLLSCNCFFEYGQAQSYTFQFDLISEKEGLSNHNVVCFLQDHIGYMWIGTENGLNRYDGYSFKVYRHDKNDSTSIAKNDILSLCEDADHKIWAGFYSGGIACFDPLTEKFINYLPDKNKNNALPTGNVRGVFADSRNNIWITNSPGGFSKFNRKTNDFTRYTLNGLSEKYSNDQKVTYNSADNFIEHNGVLYITTFDGLYTFDDAKQELRHLTREPDDITKPRFDLLHNIVFDDKGGIWGSTWAGGLFYFNLTSGFTTNYFYEPSHIASPTHNIFKKVLWKSKNELWLATPANGILIFNTSTLKFYYPEKNPSSIYQLPDGLMQSIYTDRNNNLWIAHSKGICIVRASSSIFNFQKLHVTKSYNSGYHFVGKVVKDTIHKKIFFATGLADGLNVLDEKTQALSHYEFPTTKANENFMNIADILIDKKNMVWVLSADYLMRFDERKKGMELMPMPDEIKKSKRKIILSNFCDDTSGNIWMSVLGFGVYRFNPATKSYRSFKRDTSHAGSIFSNYIYNIEKDSRGRLWFSSGNEICYYTEPGDTFVKFFNDSTQPVFNASFTIDSDDNLWLATSAGISRFNTRNPSKSNLTNYTYENGLPVEAIFNITADRKKNIWLASEKGLIKWDVKKKQFKVFNQRNGLNDYIESYRVSVTSDGEMFLGTFGGYFRFYPENITYNSPAQEIRMSSFRIFDKEIPFREILVRDKKINLNWSQNYFSFEFSSINFSDPEKIKYAYKLEGFDHDWVYCNSRRYANYTNIPKGDYVFRVKAMNSDGIWDECKLPVGITINSIFYKTWWFRILLLIALAASILWYIRILKKRRLKKESNKAIAYFANSLQGKNKVEELLWDITHNVITRTNLVDCVVYLFNRETNVLVQKAAFGDKNPEEYNILNPIEIPAGKGIVGSVAASGEAEIVSDTSIDSRYIADDTMRLSELAVPIIAEGEVIGVIDSEHPKKNFFTKEHLDLLKTIASITATKIIKAQKEMEVEEKEKRLGDLRVQVTQTRQQALQAQMNPHFIFNCLNSINGFILQNDAATASTFLIKFSKLIRLILEHSNEKSVTLESELEALKLYIEMESLRFEKKFSYKIKVDEEVMTDAVQVPPLILQPFVENSIWHGLLHKEGAGELIINILQNNGTLECIIEDNGIGREMSATFKSKTSSHKRSLGLKLTSERLALLNQQRSSDSAVQVIDLKDVSGKASGTRVVLNIPV